MLRQRKSAHPGKNTAIPQVTGNFLASNQNQHTQGKKHCHGIPQVTGNFHTCIQPKLVHPGKNTAIPQVSGNFLTCIKPKSAHPGEKHCHIFQVTGNFLTCIKPKSAQPGEKHRHSDSSFKMTETLTHGYSSESTQQELFNEYQHDRV